MGINEKLHTLSRSVRKPVPENTVLREGMSHFFDEVSYGDVEEVLEQVMSQEVDPLRRYGSDDYGSAVTNLLQGVLLTEDATDTIQGSTIDVLSLTHHLLQMNHSDVWYQLMNRAFARNPEARDGLAEAFPGVNRYTLISKASERISTSNMGFFGRMLTYYGLAVALGDELGEVVSPKAKIFKIEGIKTPSNRYVAGVEVAKRFGTRVESPAHAIERLQQLFTANPNNTRDIPALQTATTSRAFTNPHPEKASGITICPGQDMTKLLFRAYGNLLAKPNFRDRLAGQISKK